MPKIFRLILIPCFVCLVLPVHLGSAIKSKMTIAVLPFSKRSKTTSYEYLKFSLADSLATSLIHLLPNRIIRRVELEKLHGQLIYQSKSQIISAIKQNPEKWEADLFIFGSFKTSAGIVRLKISIYNPSEGASLPSDHKIGLGKNFFHQIDALAEKIVAANLGRVPEKTNQSGKFIYNPPLPANSQVLPTASLAPLQQIDAQKLAQPSPQDPVPQTVSPKKKQLAAGALIKQQTAFEEDESFNEDDGFQEDAPKEQYEPGYALVKVLVDGDGDGLYEQIIYYQDNKVISTQADAELDGKANWILFYSQGKIAKLIMNKLENQEASQIAKLDYLTTSKSILILKKKDGDSVTVHFSGDSITKIEE